MERSPASTSHVIFCLGSNAPDAATRVADALVWLSSTVTVTRATQPYMTDPEGSDIAGLPYCNAVAEGVTTLDLNTLADITKAYERRCGRLPGHKLSGQVVIDIDIVVFDNEVTDPANYNAGYFSKGIRMLDSATSDGEADGRRKVCPHL